MPELAERFVKFRNEGNIVKRVVAAQMLRGRMWGAERRMVLGVENEAQFAGRRDLVAVESGLC